MAKRVYMANANRDSQSEGKTKTEKIKIKTKYKKTLTIFSNTRGNFLFYKTHETKKKREKRKKG